MIARDKCDQERASAPLKPAEDAILIDTSDMNAEQVINKVVEIIEAKKK